MRWHWLSFVFVTVICGARLLLNSYFSVTISISAAIPILLHSEATEEFLPKLGL